MNDSGIDPIGYRVLIKPDAAERVTAGGIVIPDPTAEREQMAQMRGTLIAAGPTAGKDYGWGDWVREGASVMFAKYAGVEVKGLDGVTYRLVSDEDVAAYIKE